MRAEGSSRRTRGTSGPPLRGAARRKARVQGGPDHMRRLSSLRRTMLARDIPALVVCKISNVRYLTGFTGSSAVLVVDAGSATFLTDGRYDAQCREELGACGFDGEILVYGSDGLAACFKEAASQARERTGESLLYVEADAASWAFVMRLQEWLEGFEIRPCEGVVERLRASKDEWELSRLEAAASLTDRAFREALEWIRPGISEREIARRLAEFFEEGGAEGLSFEPIVAAGPRSALPHARPTEAKISNGDAVVLDFGCRVDGYCSDMTRTVFVGKPDRELRNIYSLVRSANRKGVEAVAAHRMARTVDAAARGVIATGGMGDRFVHSTGHGVGLEVHEWPRIGRGVTDRIPLDCVVTVEPGVYVPGLGGVRVEDMVVASRGGRRVLTTSPTRLITV